MKIWDKGIDVSGQVINFTVGDDYVLDMELVKYDCMASKAHAKMLHKINLLSEMELLDLLAGLDEIMGKVDAGEFAINKEDEDCHTAIENHLISKLGEVGKKIHTGRSRNDQVVTALRMYEKESLFGMVKTAKSFKESLISFASKNENIPMPGYTHMRKAMPASIGMWTESFVESIDDDIKLLESTLALIDKSPLGTAAGFGVPELGLDRELTKSELGFNGLIENPMYAQITRGKFEAQIIGACSNLLLTLNKLATDLILFSMTEFGFVKLPKNQCTGSSIMPQKINPDVLELIRAKYHEVLGEEFKVKGMIGNLMSGYNRDTQLTKAPVMNALNSSLECLSVFKNFIDAVEISKENCESAMTEELFATRQVNKMVKNGASFRDAYKEVGKKYAK